MDTFDLIARLADKYGLPLGFAAYFMVLQWRFHSQTVAMLNRIAGKLDVDEEKENA